MIDEQNKYGIVEKKKRQNTKSIIILSALTIIGILFLGIGIWKITYKKVLMGRVQTTTGTVYDYSTVFLKGKRYAEGYYNIYVQYTVGEKIYKNYYGKVAYRPEKGMTVTVSYDPTKPGKIINYDDYSEYTFYYILYGAIMTIVCGVLLITEIKQ